MESLQDYTKDSSTSRHKNPLDPPLFSPFLAKTLKVQGHLGFAYESACYNEKLKMILACPLGSTVQFYDANNFEPYRNRDFLKLKGSVTQISFQPENDTYVLGCSSGFVYKYNAAKNYIKKLKNLGKHVLAMTFLDPTFYAFSLLDSKKLYIGNLEHENLVNFDLNHKDSVSLYHCTKRNLLFSGLENGSVRIYRTNKLPDLQAFYSMQAHQAGKWVLSVQCIMVDRKEYVVTSSEDWTVKIWHLIKGRMRLLKVIPLPGEPHSLVYLENYKMIVTAYASGCMQFFRFPSMKMERTVDLVNSGVYHLFLMKDKNMIGATNQNGESIEFIQLHPKGHQFIAPREED